MNTYSQKEWKAKFEKDLNSFLLDVRTPEEFEEGYIPNATLINIREPQHFMEEIQKLDKTKNYYIYCKSGGRSAQACQLLDQLGFAETNNLEGGFSEWEGEKAQ